MDETNLNFEQEIRRLNEILESSSDVHIVSEELNRLYQKEDGLKILQLFLRQPSNNKSSQEVRYKVSQVILKNVQENAVQFKMANKLISILSAEIESFTTYQLVELVNICVNMISNNSDDGYNCWKEVLPKLLNVLSEKHDVEYNGSMISGLQYRNEIVLVLCANDWTENLATQIAAMFIEVTLTAEEHLKVVKKLCSSISHLQPDEIPPLTHQILQLTKSRHNVYLFIALNEYFNKKLYDVVGKDSPQIREPTDIKKMQTGEGTVLYYIYSAACSLGPQIVKDFLKVLKESQNCFEFTLQPFFVNLLLTISCISYNFEEDVTNILKNAIAKAITEKEKVAESAWLSTILPVDFDTNDALKKVFLKGFSERDKVLKGMVNLGFALLNVPKSKGKESFCTQMWSIGNDILTKLVKNCSNVSSTIFQDLVNQISQAKESGQYTDCLSSIVRGTPLNLLNSSSAMVQLLDNICARSPGQVGQKVVASLLPLTKMSHSIRDNLIIVLRKSLFPHDETCRKMAVAGFLELLKGLKISDLKAFSQSISQNYCGLTQIYSESFVDSAPSHTNEGICLEILSVLREVFKHQYDVKVVFYKGIYDCVRSNPELGNHVIDILQNRLEQFYRFGDVLPPLEFEKTIDIQGSEVLVQEPIAYLVLSTSLIVTKIRDESTRSLKLVEMLNSLCTRMAESDICHFDLDRDDFTVDEIKNIFKQEEIRQILGVYEGLMSYVLCAGKKDSINHGQLLISLFKGYTRLSDYAKTLGKPDKKKEEKGKTKDKDKDEAKDNKKKDKAVHFLFKPSPTVFNLKSASRLLSILNENALEWASEVSVDLVKGKRELHRYSIQVTSFLIKLYQNAPVSELMINSAVFGYFCKFGRILYDKSVKRFFESKEFDVSSTVAALDCFSELLVLVLSRFKHKLLEFLICITQNSGEKNVEDQLKIVIDTMLDRIEEILKDDFEEEDGKDEEQQVFFMVTIASLLINHLPKQGSQIQEVVEKLKRLCLERKIENSNTAKVLLALLLSAHSKCNPFGKLILDLALDLCNKMKLIDDEMTVQPHSRYAIINAKTANVCLITICEASRSFLGEIEWVILRLRAELVILALSNGAKLEEKRELLLDKEREACSRMNFYVKIVSTLSTIAAPPGIWSDAVLRELGNVYSALTALTKYFIIKVGRYNQPLHSTRFEKTVRLADGELSKNMYCFTEHVISDGGGKTKGGTEKAKKKDPNLLKNKVLKETKIIPRVIYEKEQFNKFILQLSNKSKSNLAGKTKQSMARDYRLFAKQVREILENENTQNDENSLQQDEDNMNEGEHVDKEDEEEDEEEISVPSSNKRQRISNK